MSSSTVSTKIVSDAMMKFPIGPQEPEAARAKAVGGVLDVLLVVLDPAIEVEAPHQAAERTAPGAGLGHVVREVGGEVAGVSDERDHDQGDQPGDHQGADDDHDGDGETAPDVQARSTRSTAGDSTTAKKAATTSQATTRRSSTNRSTPTTTLRAANTAA